MKFFILLSFFICSIFAADIKKIEQKIIYNKNILDQTKEAQDKTNSKIKTLANELTKEEDAFEKIQNNLDSISSKISANKLVLQGAKVKINELNKQSKTIEQYIASVEANIVKSVVEKYTMTLGKDLIDKKSAKEIIEKEKLQLMFENSKDAIMKSNLQYFQITTQKNDNDAQRKTLETFIASGVAEEKKFTDLKRERESKVSTLREKHKSYQQELKAIVRQQNDLNNLLSQLNIVKETELEKIKSEQARQQREQLKKAKLEELKLAKDRKNSPKSKTDSTTAIATNEETRINSKDIKMLSKEVLENDADMKVKNIGDTTQGIKVSSSSGISMQAPLSGYTVSKKFGEYFDPIYKIKLYNDSVTLKANSKNEKVYSALKGQVVYAKNDAGSLGNVVILKHAGEIHTIYSRLSQIAPTITVGKVIPQGYVVGRIEDTLVFQATKSNKYLNPEELF
ncbi:MAG: peptidoglycan DD-metalloendopeptidase family protein [Arcobacter sp.]|nr:peptidoglycan DD-metalloendopeptidase family protein [Arcobacter sp.]